MRNALNKLKRKNPVRLAQQRHIHKPDRISKQASVKHFYVPKLGHDLMNEKVRHQLAHVIYNTSYAVQNRRSA